MDLFQDYFIEELIKVQSHVYKPPGFSGIFLKNDDGLVYAYFTKTKSIDPAIPNEYLMELSKVHQLFQNIHEGYINPCGLLTFTNQDPAILQQSAHKSKHKTEENPIETKKGVGASSFNIVTTTLNLGVKDIPNEIMINCFNISNPMYLIALIRIRARKTLKSPLHELPLLAANSIKELQEIIIRHVGPLGDIDSIKKYALQRENFLIFEDETVIPSNLLFKPEAILIGSHILPKSRPVIQLETWLWAAVLRSLCDNAFIPHIKQYFLSDFWKTIMNKPKSSKSKSSDSLLIFFSNCLSDFYPLIKAKFSFDDFAKVMLELFDPASAKSASSSEIYNRPLFQAIGKNVLIPSNLFVTNSPQDWYFKHIPFYQPRLFYYDDKMFIGMSIENKVTVCRVSSYEHERSYWQKEFSEQRNTIAQLVKRNTLPAEVYRMITIHDTSNPFLATCRLVKSLINPMYEELYALLLSHYPEYDMDLYADDLQFIENQINKSEVDLGLLTEQVQILICTKLANGMKPHSTRLFSISIKAWLYYNKDTFVILGDTCSVSKSVTLLGFLNNKNIKVNHVWDTETSSSTFLDTAACMQIAINMLDGKITDYRGLIRQTVLAPVWNLIDLCIEYMLNNPPSISNIRIISELSELSTHYATEIDSSLSFPDILYNIFQKVYYENLLDSTKGDIGLHFIVTKGCNVIPIPGGYILRDKSDQIFFIPSNLFNDPIGNISLFSYGITDDTAAESVLNTQKGFHVRLFVKILYNIRPAFFNRNRLNSFSFWANLYDEKHQNLVLQVGDISSTMESIIKDEKSVCGYAGEFVSHFVSKMCQKKSAYQILYEETSLYFDFNNKLLLLIPDLSCKYGLMHLSDSFMLFILTNMDIVFRYFINDDTVNNVSFVMVHCAKMEMNKISWPHYKDSIESLLNMFNNHNMLESITKHYQNSCKLNEEDKSSVCFLLYNNNLKKLHDKMINFYRQYYNASNSHRFLSYNSSSWKKNILSPSLIPSLKSYIPLVESVYSSESQRILITESKAAFDQLFKHDRYRK